MSPLARRAYHRETLPGHFAGAVRRILALQKPDGAIPWYDRGVWDAWNHTEAAMALLVAGRIEEADAAFACLEARQDEDGAWPGQYGNAAPVDERGRYIGEGRETSVRDTNFCAYPAVGVWHYWRLTRDRAALARLYPMARAGLDFVLSLQSDHGEIRFAARDPETPQEDALLAGNASIYHSLACGVRLAETAGDRDRAHRWARARARLGHALRHRPERFDRSWGSKARFSMDWYYPVLSGAVRGPEAHARIDARWSEFVEPGKGCRCVSDQPWVTVAESAELAMALLRIGRAEDARALLAAQDQWRDGDGAYWMGWQFAEDVAWPEEKPAWTAAAVILATDELYGLTPAAGLFAGEALSEPAQDAQ